MKPTALDPLSQLPGADGLPRQLTDRYRLEAGIGRGGMGVVYRAQDLLERRPVAIKLLRAELAADPEFVTRFIREVKHTARMSHPHVVEVLDVGRAGAGELYFAMELLDGQPLSAALRRAHRLEPQRVARVALQLSSALERAHGLGIVHRDIKPANVFLVRQGADADFVKVLDFGVAKAVGQDTQITGTGLMIGTLEYMAPEQILGHAVDGRADIYAVGAMLYKLLAGSGLFPDCAPATLIHHHLTVAPQLLTERAPDANIPAALEHIVRRCLAKKPEQRYADAGALSKALELFLAGGAVEEPQTATSRPSLDAAVAQGALEIEERSEQRLLPFLRCARCGRDNDRFAARCAQCDDDLGTPGQRSFMRQLELEQREPSAPAVSVPPPWPGHEATPPPAPKPAAPAQGEGLLQRVSETLDRVPMRTWREVFVGALLAAGLGRLFDLVGSSVATALVLIAGIALLGMWNARSPD